MPMDIIYGELVSSFQPVGCPNLRYKDVCKRDIRSTEIAADSWESVAADRVIWRMAIDDGAVKSEEQRCEMLKRKRERPGNRVLQVFPSRLPVYATYMR